MRIRASNVIALALVLTASCALGDRPRANRSHQTVVETTDSDGGFVGAISGAREVPRESNPAIAQSDPVDVGTSQCPGVRLLRVDRRHTGAPPSAPPLPPRYYGRDDHGRIWPLRNVLACELQSSHWVQAPLAEATNLVLWRGPYVFKPDEDCDFRDPTRTEPIEHGRRMFAQERCRPHGHGGPTVEHTIVIDVSDDYSRLVAHY
jgi:hypothetical protein